MTRYAWIMQCAARYLEVLEEIEPCDAMWLAGHNATAQCDAFGPCQLRWMEPAEAANADIATWDDEEREVPLMRAAELHRAAEVSEL